MAEETEDSQKTEEPTPKRLEDARRKGQVASSREVNHWFMILAGAVSFMALAPGMSNGIVRAISRFVTEPDLIITGRNGIGAALKGMLGEVLLAVLPVIMLLVIAAILAGVVQSGLVFSGERIKPELSKISIAKGAKRLFSLKSVAEFVKSVLKLIIVGGVVTLLFIPIFDDLTSITTMPIVATMTLLQSLAVRLFIGVLAVMSVIAVIDFIYQRFEHMKSMRMSRQEIKDELKQTEGDPQVRARLRQIRTERARRRMMAAVPEADVVITNPTHFAVALKYEPQEMSAPRLVAKGADAIAERIREVARDNDVPLVENPPLARALFASVDLEQEIPAEHYKAVAEIISYVFQLKGRTMPH
ncbi:MAG: flagellar biosynthesis protein FlhB [Alphaproteobacteria bacterium]|nr:flagellar biosynthesis protein FlhB [Alphaproteobacteria bacterium]